ncbi:MAG TPA: anhydro-N-acetylmuramic acid kinase [Candidatus Marinimicrobia bacterium]|nr:anhydro-N-acetylmuramic acid kinase [Candidatus Neomarinimicrobiota bacterium]
MIINLPLSNQEKIRCAGLMTGTSMDGLDICVADIQMSKEKLDYQVIGTGEIPFPQELKQRIRKSLNGSTPLLCELNYDLGRFYGDALSNFLDTERISGVELIGTHGQTVHHVSGHSSLQIGEPSFLAERLKVPVVSDFRAKDIAAGGTGAPLIPFLDQYLFGKQVFGAVLLNIGGVANVTILPPKQSGMPILGFDTGPGMALLDEQFQRIFAKAYDEDGSLAGEGRINEALLKMWLQHPFIQAAAPKSTGRDVFGLNWLDEHQNELDSLADVDMLATLAAFTADAVALNLQPYLESCEIQKLYLSGGGSHHSVISNRLKEKLRSLDLAKTESLGVDVNSKEALGFAVLAVAFVKGIPGNIPSVSGAKKPVLLGKLTLG